MTGKRRGRRLCGVGCVAVLAGVLLLAWLPGDGAVTVGDEAKAALPADLGHVPTDALAVVTFRLGDLWNHDTTKAARDLLAKEDPGLLSTFEKFFGVPLAQVERLSVVVTGFNQEPFFAVATSRPYPRARVIAGGTEEQYKGRKLYVSGGNRAVCPINDRAYLLGNRNQVRAALDSAGAKESGPLSPALRAAAGKHALVIGVNPQGIRREVPEQLPPQVEPFKPLFQARQAVLIVDLGKQVRAALRVTFPNEADARKGERAVQALLALGQSGVAAVLTEAARKPDPSTRKTIDVLKQVKAGLEEASVKQQGPALTAAMQVKVEFPTVSAALLEAIKKVRQSASRAQSVNNLKQLALAFHSYHGFYGSFPPAAIYGKDGKPLLSWRVMVLPFIEQGELYKQFHLNEAWDSPHNKKLLAKMPKVFAAPEEKSIKAHETYYQVFISKDSADVSSVFKGKRGSRIADISDGTSNTLLIVEAAKAVPWTKPEDLPYSPDKPLPKLGGLFPGGFNAAFCDGSVRFLSGKIKEVTLRSLITRNGGEVINTNEF